MNEENIKSDDYINVPGFKKVLIIILRSFFFVFYRVLEVIKNSSLLLIAGLVSGLIVGYSYYTSRPVFYEVSMISESTLLHKQTVAEMLNQLDLLVKTGSYPKLSKEISLSETEARQIRSIGALTLDNDKLENDTSSKIHQPFKIVATIKESELADKIQSSLVNYFNNKPSLKKMKQDKMLIYQQKLLYIDNELIRLDSLKLEYNRFLATSKISATYYNNAFDPAKIYEQSEKLMNEKEKILDWQSTDAMPIVVIDEFKSTLAPQSASLLKSLALGTFAFVGLSFILGLLLDLDKRIRKYK